MNNTGINQNSAKLHNRVAILKLIRDNPTLTRSDIARRLSLTRAGVALIVSDLIEQGVLCETVRQSSTNRSSVKKHKYLEINTHYHFSCGVFVSDSGFTVGLSTLSIDALDKQFSPMPPLEQLAEAICGAINKLLNDNFLTIDSIIGIGYCFEDSVLIKSGLTQRRLLPVLKQVSRTLRIPFCIEDSSVALAYTNMDICKLPLDSNLVTIRWFNNRLIMTRIIGGQPLLCDDQPREFGENLIIPPFTPTNEIRLQTYNELLASDAVIEHLSQIEGISSRRDAENVYFGRYDGMPDAAITAKKRLLSILATLLYNTSELLACKHIFLIHLDLSASDIDYITQLVYKASGCMNFGKRLHRNAISENNAFLCGCDIAMRRFFIENGALPESINE